jgi:hypothetical protein
VPVAGGEESEQYEIERQGDDQQGYGERKDQPARLTARGRLT